MLQKKYQALVVCFLLLPCIELGWLAYTYHSVTTLEQWQQMAKVVRREWRSTDMIRTIPLWMDPLLRWVLGDLISIEKAGASDDTDWQRIWLVSRGRSLKGLMPSGSPDFDRKFGSLRLRRWNVKTDHKLYNFVTHIDEASVSVTEGNRVNSCPRLIGRPSGGGLLTGPMAPADRFHCDKRRPWLWVGKTVVEDLDFQPRLCIWQHPGGAQPIRVTFPNVTLADAIVLYGGIYYMYERDHIHAPVTMRVFLNDVFVGQFRHVDGDGWKKYVVVTERAKGVLANVAIEVTASPPDFRGFCWSGYTRGISGTH